LWGGIEVTGHFSSIEPYKTERMLGGGGRRKEEDDDFDVAL
jgi:hypothetical protein